MADDPPKTMGINVAITPEMNIMIQIVDGDKVLAWVALSKANALDYAGKLEMLANLIPNDQTPTRKLQS